MNTLQKAGPEEVTYSGKIFEVVKQPMKVGEKKVEFEIARRSPGTRLIIVQGNQMLITKEFRPEINGFDYRLPGGKVFDTLAEYKQNLSADIVSKAMEAAKKECREETGLITKSIKHFTTSHCGATIVWDLIYFIIDEFEESEKGQELETGETIEVNWMSFDEVKELCMAGKMSEDRSVGVLWRYFMNNSSI